MYMLDEVVQQAAIRPNVIRRIIENSLRDEIAPFYIFRAQLQPGGGATGPVEAD